MEVVGLMPSQLADFSIVLVGFAPTVSFTVLEPQKSVGFLNLM